MVYAPPSPVEYAETAAVEVALDDVDVVSFPVDVDGKYPLDIQN